MNQQFSFKINLGAAILVAAMAFAAYANNLKNGFVGDDHYLVENNPILEHGPSFRDLFLKPWGAEAKGEFEKGMNQGYYQNQFMVV